MCFHFSFGCFVVMGYTFIRARRHGDQYARLTPLFQYSRPFNVPREVRGTCQYVSLSNGVVRERWLRATFRVDTRLNFCSVLMLCNNRNSEDARRIVYLIRRIIFIRRFARCLRVAHLCKTNRILCFLRVKVSTPLSKFVQSSKRTCSRFLIFIPIYVEASFMSNRISFNDLVNGMRLI